MFENNNVIAFIFTFLPALIYSFVLYITIPANTIKWRIASLFFLMGLLSTILVNAVHYTFPNWDSPISTSVVIGLLVTAFIKVGFLEETCKFVMFKLTEWYRNKKYFDHPDAIMFYAMSVSCGFAVSENILYAQIYGGWVLFTRSFTAVLIHMICGLMLGYFVAIGRIIKRTNRKNKKRTMILYTLFGIGIASIYHGVYDFNLFVGNALVNYISYFILSVGLAMSYLMTTHFRLFKRRNPKRK